MAENPAVPGGLAVAINTPGELSMLVQERTEGNCHTNTSTPKHGSVCFFS